MAGTGQYRCERLLATREMKTYAGFKFNFNGGTPVAASSAAYTQTFSTSGRTVSNLTASAVTTTAATSTTPFGYTTQAQADAIVAAINALRTDVTSVKSNLNSVIDDLQARGIVV